MRNINFIFHNASLHTHHSLNLIANVLSASKSSVILGDTCNELHLKKLIFEKFDEITDEHYSSFY